MVRRGYIVGALAAAVIALAGCESDRAGELLAPLFFTSPAETETVIDHHEPNDSLSLAIAIVPDNQPFATAFHRLSDVDYFTFVAAPGVSYVIYTTNLDPNVATRISIVNERDETLATTASGGTKQGEALMRWTPNVGGQYWVRVSSVGSSVGMYHLTIGIASDPYEPDDTIAQASHTVAYSGVESERTFHALDDIDHTAFTGYAGFTYTVSTVSLATYGDSAPRINLRVLDDTGAELTVSTSNSASGVTVTIETDGTYYIRTTPANEAALGAYTIRVIVSSDPYEPDNSITQTSTITINGESQRRSIGPNDEDYVAFDVVDSQQYSISVIEVSEGVELELSVHHVSGAQLGVLVDEGSANQHLWRWTSPANLTTADQFCVRIRCTTDFYGTYRLSITRE